MVKPVTGEVRKLLFRILSNFQHVKEQQDSVLKQKRECLQNIEALTVWGQRSPTISHITQKQIRDIGSQVDLECSLHYGRDYPVLWIKYDRHKNTEILPLSVNSFLVIRDSRFSFRFDAASGTYTLSIKDIQETDAGWYQCQVIVSVSKKITAEVELQVRRPPSVISI